MSGPAALRAPLSLVAAALMGVCTACDLTPPPAPEPTPTAAATATAATATAPLIEWVKAADGDVPLVVLAEMERAKKDGRTLLVYVGATWCEPCQRFHEAAEKGELAGGLPPLRMLEFDLDKDGDRLVAGGYKSRMIPLFVMPGADGRGTGPRMEGGIKGSGAAINIENRLRALIARSRGS